MTDALIDFYDKISIIDLIYLILTILSLIKCYKKGFVLSILSMAKWLLAYIITLIIFPRVKPYLKDIIDNEYVLDVGLGISIFIIVIFLIVMVIGSAISSIEETDTTTWPVEQVEIVEISNEGRCCGESQSYYRVEIKFPYDGNERSTTLKCNAERDAEAYVEDNPVGTTIDIRVNPVKGESPFFEIEGGCPSPEYTTTEIVSSAACFGLIIVIIGFEKISEVIRSKRQG